MRLEAVALEQGWRARVAHHLRTMRRRAGVSRQRMADELGVSLDTVRRAERGDVDVRGEVVEGFERVCGERLFLCPGHQLEDAP